MKHRLKEQQTKLNALIQRHPYLAAFLAGCIYYGIAVSWMFTIRTAEIAKGNAAKFVGISAAIIMVGSFAMGFVFFVWFLRRMHVDIRDKKALILIPSAWALSEFIRAYFFSIVSLGPTGRVGAYWSYGDIGYVFGLTPLTYLGRLGGVYFLSFIGVLLIVLGIRTLYLKSYRFTVLILSVVIIATFLCWKIYAQANGKTINVAALSYHSVQYPNIQSDEAKPYFIHRPFVSPQAVVLPEYSGFYSQDSKPNDYLLEKYTQRRGVVIQSRREIQDSYNKNMLVFTTPTGTLLNAQQKWFTVPSGEYVPYVYQVLLAYAGQGQLLLDFRNQKSVLPGDSPETPYAYEGVKYGSLVCSGITSPEHYRRLAADGATILTNSASLGSLGVTSFHHMQAQLMAQRYAVDTARPFVQSAKDAPAYIYDHNGQLLAKTNKGLIQADVATNSRRTPYVLFGNWIIALSTILVCMRLYETLKNKKKKGTIKRK